MVKLDVFKFFLQNLKIIFKLSSISLNSFSTSLSSSSSFSSSDMSSAFNPLYKFQSSSLIPNSSLSDFFLIFY